MSRKLSKILPIWLTGLLLMTGCATLSDYHYEHTQLQRARKNYRQSGRAECSRYPKDYKQGWLDGFYEVATGGPTCPPAIAPPEYWKPDRILDDCDNRRHAYYSGWQDGAACASKYPDTHYLKIYESCECPFPRCACANCGNPSCSCGGACSADGGMACHPGAIEADREIMMMPIPDESIPAPIEDSKTGVPDAPAAPAAEPATSTAVDKTPRVSETTKAGPFTYHYKADNSVTIEYSPSDTVTPLVANPNATLSDFDVELDGIGLIE